MSVKLDVRYEAGHSIRQTWEHDPAIRCPHCGKGTVWTEQSPGDYYMGPESACSSCGAFFYLSLDPPELARMNWQNRQILEAIQSEKTS